VVPPRHRPPRAFVVEVALVGLMTFAVAVTIGLVTGAPTGTMADWVAGISTFAALIAAIFGAWYAAQAFGVETRREDRWAQQQRLAQASLVAAWVGETVKEVDFTNPVNRALRYAIDSTYAYKGVYLRNASDLPVTSVQYRLFLDDEPAGLRWVGTLPPGETPIFVGDQPGDRDLVNPDVQNFSDAFQVAVTFRDAAGRSWSRDQHGALSEGRPDWN
jgi:hypothetical protein